MSLFEKRKKNKGSALDSTPRVDANTADIMQAAQKTKQANDKFAEVLQRNHITVKIYSQLGGKPKRRRA